MQLIRFLLQRDQQLKRASTQSEVPKEVTFFELPVVLNPYPHLVQVNEHGGTVVARPSVVAGSKYEEVTRAYIEAVHSVLTRKKAPSTAAQDLEARLAQITGLPTGQPAK